MARPRNEVPKFTLELYRGKYAVRYTEGGRKKRVSTGTEVQQEAQRFLNDFVAGRNTPSAPDEPTIREIYLAYTASRKGKVTEYKNLVYAGNALLPILGDLSPSSLTDERVQNYMKVRRRQRIESQAADRKARLDKFAKRTANGTCAINGIAIKPPREIVDKPLSESTLNRDLVLLRAALNWAVKNNWIVKAPHIDVPGKARNRERWLTRAEYDRLLQCAVEPHVRLFIVLGLNTGARKSAILQLTWDRVKLESRRIDFGEGHGKKRRARHVPINQLLADELEKAAKIATSDFVVEYAGAGLKDIKTGFSAACRRAFLTGVAPHTLRHTAASWMVQAGISYAQVGKFLGNSAAIVESTYSHHAPDHLRDAADALLKAGN